jgi:hypothetical protein
LSTTGGAPTRAKCRTCGKTFTPTFTDPVEGSGAVYLNAGGPSSPMTPLSPLPPLRDAGPVPLGSSPRSESPNPSAATLLNPPPPATRVEAPSPQPETARPLFEFSSSSTAVVTAPPPAAPASEPPPPPDAKVERRVVEPQPVTPQLAPEVDFRASQLAAPEPVVTRPAPAAPVVLEKPAAPPKAAPARKTPRQRRDRDRDQDRFQEFGAKRLRWHEILVGVVILVGGLVGLGLLCYQYYGPDKPSDGDAAQTADDADPSAIVPVDLNIDPKPRPPQLFGAWELRSDDGRAGQLILDPDGGLIATSATDESPFPPYKGHWFFIDRVGDRFLLEFGTLWHGPDSYRVALDMTGPDAFTLVETVKGGAPVRDQHRFIRAAAPAMK